MSTYNNKNKQDLDGISLHFTAGLNEQQAADIAGVTVRTWRKWTRDGYPEFIKKYFLILAGGLPHPAWQHWRIAQDGKLYSPDLTQGFSPREIEKIPWLLEFVDCYQEQESRPRQYIIL